MYIKVYICRTAYFSINSNILFHTSIS
ncbi:MAG: hypothetical protein E7488_07940 [Ruminococcaceae bacterium]|nr:hypothetical protein [Oscillospiraceae bacterium]